MGQNVHRDNTDSLRMKGTANMLSYKQAIATVEVFLEAHKVVVEKRQVREDNKRTYIKGHINVDNSFEKIYIIVKDKDDVVEAEWVHIEGYRAPYLCNEFKKAFQHYGFAEKTYT